jgi:Mrp family chromosome partitioning ATPase
MSLPRTKELFNKLREQFDYIVIDTPPIGLLVDAQVASAYADATLYIVRQRFTFKDQIKIPNELARNKKMPKLSFVLNDNIPDTGSYGYGYTYGYGYSNEYGYGYTDKKPKKKGFLNRIFKREPKTKTA